MSKNNFKKDIQQRYKGRGNTWVKIIKGTEAYDLFEKKLNSIDNIESFDYYNHVKREGYGWVRFSKVTGRSEEPLENFELRYKGSKLDHADCILTIPYSLSKDMPLLGNTPVKLQIETDPNNRKVKEVSFVKKNPSLDSDEIESLSLNEVDVSIEIKSIKEAALTKPCNKELENWYQFLKLNGLYEENV